MCLFKRGTLVNHTTLGYVYLIFPCFKHEHLKNLCCNIILSFPNLRRGGGCKCSNTSVLFKKQVKNTHRKVVSSELIIRYRHSGRYPVKALLVPHKLTSSRRNRCRSQVGLPTYRTARKHTLKSFGAYAEAPLSHMSPGTGGLD